MRYFILLVLLTGFTASCQYDEIFSWCLPSRSYVRTSSASVTLVEYRYDSRNRLSSSGIGSGRASYFYSLNGDLKRVNFTDGSYDSLVYDKHGRIIQVYHHRDSTMLYESYEYGTNSAKITFNGFYGIGPKSTYEYSFEGSNIKSMIFTTYQDTVRSFTQLDEYSNYDLVANPVYVLQLTKNCIGYPTFVSKNNVGLVNHKLVDFQNGIPASTYESFTKYNYQYQQASKTRVVSAVWGEYNEWKYFDYFNCN